MTRALSAAAYADSKKPYGDVTYADPSDRADKKKRYPLDSEEHCRAAWSYINMPKNAAKYSAEDLAKIKAKIKAAGRKYGITFAEDVKAAASAQMLGVELVRPGTWDLLTGKRTFTQENLRDAADFFAATGATRIPVGFGHLDPRFDGDPAFGWVANIRYAEDAKGPVLLGDLVDLDDWLAAAAPTRWPNRSIEGFADLEWNGRTYSLALTRLGLLGSTPPAMPNLRSLADLREAIAAAAASCGSQFLAAAVPQEAPEDPAAEAVVPPSKDKEAGMDPAKIRERLGLDDDVSDDDIMEALGYAGFVPAPEPTASAEPAPVAASAPPAVTAPGTIILASSVWEQTQDTIKSLKAFVDRSERNERDQVIAAAVTEGKFTPAQKPHFTALWDADPKGTRPLIDSLMRNSALAVLASGHGREPDEDELEAEFAHLFPPPARKEASRG